MEAGLGGEHPQAQARVGGCSGRGSASPRICEVELCKACSPIFWMALKYTSAASDRAAWGWGMGPDPAPPPRPPISILWRPLLTGHAEGTLWGLPQASVTGRGVLGGA